VGNTVTVTLAFHRATLPFHTEFPLAGTRCVLSTNSHNLLRHSVPWQSKQTLAEAPFLSMEILEDSGPSSETPALPHFRGLRHLVFALLEPKCFLSFDLLRKRVMGVVSPAAARDPYFWNTKLLPITIGILGTTVGVAPLHCACLDRNGSGLLVVGNSGAGKSTLTAALAIRGLAVVSDDWTYVSQRDGKLIAHGLFAPVKLLPETIQYFSELQQSIPKKTLNGEIAYEIDPVEVFGSKSKAFAEPKWILLLERTSVRGCRFMPCRPEHLRLFFEKNAEKLPLEVPGATRNRSEIIRSLSSCESWVLRTGDDPLQTAAAIDGFLSGV
jgi:hypothetical protein